MRTAGGQKGAWRVVLFYGVTGSAVAIIAATVLYSWFARQMLAASIVAEPVPSVLLLADDGSEQTAAWVRLLNDAKVPTKLVEPARIDAAPGVVAIGGLKGLAPALRAEFQRRLAAGQGVVLIGSVPREVTALVGFATEEAESGGLLEIGDQASPVLARVTPSHQAWFTPGRGPVAVETPKMQIDARWRQSARAAIAHLTTPAGGRVLWLGLDPAAMQRARDPQLELMLRTALRWVDGQPVSEGAAGELGGAQTITVGGRVEARRRNLAWSADRVADQHLLSITLRNRGDEAIPNAAIRVWLPPESGSPQLAGSWFSRRRVSMIHDGDERSVTLTLPALGPHEERLLALRFEPARDG